MRTSTSDPTAGVTARAIRQDPGAPRPIADPTDPRYEHAPEQAQATEGVEQRIVDPTDPECGRSSA